MLFKKYLFLIIFSIIATWGCQHDQRKEQLDLREQAIIKREQEFSLKEADYQSLIKMRDSLLTKKDTVMIQYWPEDIAGIWNGKSVCRESNCPEYVIGDQRSNTWEFLSDSTGLYTRVTSNNSQTIRVYSARFDSTRIQLFYQSDTSATRAMQINVELARAGQGLLKGTQNIGIDKSCTARFSVDLSRPSNR